jgi:U3 small nucleolar RNA-associated protein 14
MLIFLFFTIAAHAESLEFPVKKPVKSVAKRPAGADDVNPDEFMTVEAKKLRSDLPEIIGYNEEEDSEDEDEQRKTIAEAFADDDVVADFQKEKADIIAAGKPKVRIEFLFFFLWDTGTGSRMLRLRNIFPSRIRNKHDG